MAASRMHAESVMRRRKAFTLLELVVVIGIAAVLLAMLLSVLGNVRRAARTVTCAANLTQLGHAMMLYVNDHRGVLPPAAITYEWTPPFVMRMTTWDDLLAPYIKGDASQDQLDSGFTPDPSLLLRCPEDVREPPSFAGLRSYSMTTAGFSALGDRAVDGMGIEVSSLAPNPHTRGIRLSLATNSSRTLLLVENHSGTGDDGNLAGFIYLASIPAPYWQRVHVIGPDGGQPSGPPVHAEQWNYLFCDGHVERLPPVATITPRPGLPPPQLLYQQNGMWTHDPTD